MGSRISLSSRPLNRLHADYKEALMDSKHVFALIAVLCAFIKFGPYLVRMLTGKAKPHAFSWATWGAMEGLVFTLSILNGGGAGAWVYGVGGLVCTSVFVFALFKGEKDITVLDTASFSVGILAIGTYAISRNAVVSVCLAASIDILGFIPTYRKSYSSPHSEPAITYTLSFLGAFFSILALEKYTFATTFFQCIHVLDNVAFVTFIMIRRSMMNRNALPLAVGAE
jgi:hypothetical protein